MTHPWGEPPWRVASVAGSRPLPDRCEVAVVGGGLTGLAAALELARRGLDVALLEAGAIGAGASGRTGGTVLEGTAAGPLPGVEACIEALERVVRRERIDCDLTLGSCRELSHHPGTRGERPLWRDGEGHIYVAGTVPGGSVDAGALLTGLARAARAAGATIHEHRAVRRLELGAQAILRLDGAEVRAESVLVALNAYTPRLLDTVPVLKPALALASCTAPLEPSVLSKAGLDDRMPFYTVDLPYLWGCPLRDGRVIIGAGLVFAEDLDAIDVEAGEAHEMLERLTTRTRGLHPALSQVTIERRWAGPIAIAMSRPPLLGRHPQAPNVIVAGGYGGHGVALSVTVGEIGARAIAAGEELPAWGVF